VGGRGESLAVYPRRLPSEGAFFLSQKLSVSYIGGRALCSVTSLNHGGGGALAMRIVAQRLPQHPIVKLWLIA
jgi:hypothetical protein